MFAVGRVLSIANLSKSAFLVTHRTLYTGQAPLASVRDMSCVCPNLQAIPKVDIDPEGVFKYILIKVHKKDQDVSVTIARGYKRCEYHSDIYDEVQAHLEAYDCEALGGGRISHDPANKKIHVYGYSQGYGKADHEITAKLIKEAYPAYTITISDEGY